MFRRKSVIFQILIQFQGLLRHSSAIQRELIQTPIFAYIQHSIVLRVKVAKYSAVAKTGARDKKIALTFVP